MDVTGVGCRDLSKFRLIQWITIQSFLPNHTVFHYTGTCWNKVGPFLLFINLTGKNLTYHRKRTLTSCKIPYFIVVQTSHLYFGYFFVGNSWRLRYFWNTHVFSWHLRSLLGTSSPPQRCHVGFAAAIAPVDVFLSSTPELWKKSETKINRCLGDHKIDWLVLPKLIFFWNLKLPFDMGDWKKLICQMLARK